MVPNFDSKFKIQGHILFPSRDGHLQPHGSVVHRAILPGGATGPRHMGPYRVELKSEPKHSRPRVDECVFAVVVNSTDAQLFFYKVCDVLDTKVLQA